MAVALTLTPEYMSSPHASDASVLDEVAHRYFLLGKFLAEQRDNPLEGCQLLAEAEARYRELAHYHEVAAQAHKFKKRQRAFEELLQHRALDLAEDMHNIQRRYQDDKG